MISASRRIGVLRRGLPAALVLAFSLSGQNRAVQFEAASVKPASPNLPGGRTGAMPPVGGPGTPDPGRISYRAVSVKTLFRRAYDAADFQIAGPGWLDTELFEFAATLPPATAEEQLRTMLQNLLAERFQMKVHRETKEFSGYSLVLARNGPKFKPSEDSAPSAAVLADAPLQLGSDGYFIPPQRPGMFLQMTGSGGVRSTFRQVTMPSLAGILQSQLNRPVTDSTGLSASYDFTLNFSREGLNFGRNRIPVSMGDPEPQPDIFTALQSQLGLRLEPNKTSADVIVIDQVEKTPIGN